MDISRYCLLVGIFTEFQYFPKNRAILVQKLGEEKKLSKSVSGAPPPFSLFKKIVFKNNCNLLPFLFI